MATHQSVARSCGDHKKFGGQVETGDVVSNHDRMQAHADRADEDVVAAGDQVNDTGPSRPIISSSTDATDTCRLASSAPAPAALPSTDEDASLRDIINEEQQLDNHSSDGIWDGVTVIAIDEDDIAVNETLPVDNNPLETTFCNGHTKGATSSGGGALSGHYTTNLSLHANLIADSGGAACANAESDSEFHDVIYEDDFESFSECDSTDHSRAGSRRQSAISIKNIIHEGSAIDSQSQPVRTFISRGNRFTVETQYHITSESISSGLESNLNGTAVKLQNQGSFKQKSGASKSVTWDCQEMDSGKSPHQPSYGDGLTPFSGSDQSDIIRAPPDYLRDRADSGMFIVKEIAKGLRKLERLSVSDAEEAVEDAGNDADDESGDDGEEREDEAGAVGSPVLNQNSKVCDEDSVNLPRDNSDETQQGPFMLPAVSPKRSSSPTDDDSSDEEAVRRAINKYQSMVMNDGGFSEENCAYSVVMKVASRSSSDNVASVDTSNSSQNHFLVQSDQVGDNEEPETHDPSGSQTFPRHDNDDDDDDNVFYDTNEDSFVDVHLDVENGNENANCNRGIRTSTHILHASDMINSRQIDENSNKHPLDFYQKHGNDNSQDCELQYSAQMVAKYNNPFHMFQVKKDIEGNSYDEQESVGGVAPSKEEFVDLRKARDSSKADNCDMSQCDKRRIDQYGMKSTDDTSEDSASESDKSSTHSRMASRILYREGQSNIADECSSDAEADDLNMDVNRNCGKLDDGTSESDEYFQKDFDSRDITDAKDEEQNIIENNNFHENTSSVDDGRHDGNQGSIRFLHQNTSASSSFDADNCVHGMDHKVYGVSLRQSLTDTSSESESSSSEESSAGIDGNPQIEGHSLEVNPCKEAGNVNESETVVSSHESSRVSSEVTAGTETEIREATPDRLSGVTSEIVEGTSHKLSQVTPGTELETGEGTPDTLFEFVPWTEIEIGEGIPHKSSEVIQGTESEIAEGTPDKSSEVIPRTESEIGEGIPHKSSEVIQGTESEIREGTPDKSSEVTSEIVEGTPDELSAVTPGTESEIGEGTPHKLFEFVPGTESEIREGIPDKSSEVIPRTESEIGEGTPDKSSEVTSEIVEGTPHKLSEFTPGTESEIGEGTSHELCKVTPGTRSEIVEGTPDGLSEVTPGTESEIGEGTSHEISEVTPGTESEIEEGTPDELSDKSEIREGTSLESREATPGTEPENGKDTSSGSSKIFNDGTEIPSLSNLPYKASSKDAKDCGVGEEDSSDWSSSSDGQDGIDKRSETMPKELSVEKAEFSLGMPVKDAETEDEEEGDSRASSEDTLCSVRNERDAPPKPEQCQLPITDDVGENRQNPQLAIDTDAVSHHETAAQYEFDDTKYAVGGGTVSNHGNADGRTDIQPPSLKLTGPSYMDLVEDDPDLVISRRFEASPEPREDLSDGLSYVALFPPHTPPAVQDLSPPLNLPRSTEKGNTDDDQRRMASGETDQFEEQSSSRGDSGIRESKDTSNPADSIHSSRVVLKCVENDLTHQVSQTEILHQVDEMKFKENDISWIVDELKVSSELDKSDEPVVEESSCTIGIADLKFQCDTPSEDKFVESLEPPYGDASEDEGRGAQLDRKIDGSICDDETSLSEGSAVTDIERSTVDQNNSSFGAKSSNSVVDFSQRSDSRIDGVKFDSNLLHQAVQMSHELVDNALALATAEVEQKLGGDAPYQGEQANAIGPTEDNPSPSVSGFPEEDDEQECGEDCEKEESGKACVEDGDVKKGQREVVKVKCLVDDGFTDGLASMPKAESPPGIITRISLENGFLEIHNTEKDATRNNQSDFVDDNVSLVESADGVTLKHPRDFVDNDVTRVACESSTDVEVFSFGDQSIERCAEDELAETNVHGISQSDELVGKAIVISEDSQGSSDDSQVFETISTSKEKVSDDNQDSEFGKNHKQLNGMKEQKVVERAVPFEDNTHGTTIGDRVEDNSHGTTIGDRVEDNTHGTTIGDCVEDNSHGTTIGDCVEDNTHGTTIGDHVEDNTHGGSTMGDRVEDNTHGTTIGDCVEDNTHGTTIGDHVEDNTHGGSTMGDRVEDNSYGGSTMGDHVEDKTHGGSTLGDHVEDNSYGGRTLGDHVEDNSHDRPTMGNHVKNATHGGTTMGDSVGDNTHGGPTIGDSVEDNSHGKPAEAFPVEGKSLTYDPQAALLAGLGIHLSPIVAHVEPLIDTQDDAVELDSSHTSQGTGSIDASEEEDLQRDPTPVGIHERAFDDNAVQMHAEEAYDKKQSGDYITHSAPDEMLTSSADDMKQPPAGEITDNPHSVDYSGVDTKTVIASDVGCEESGQTDDEMAGVQLDAGDKQDSVSGEQAQTLQDSPELGDDPEKNALCRSPIGHQIQPDSEKTNRVDEECSAELPVDIRMDLHAVETDIDHMQEQEITAGSHVEDQFQYEVSRMNDDDLHENRESAVSPVNITVLFDESKINYGDLQQQRVSAESPVDCQIQLGADETFVDDEHEKGVHSESPVDSQIQLDAGLTNNEDLQVPAVSHVDSQVQPDADKTNRDELVEADFNVNEDELDVSQTNAHDMHRKEVDTEPFAETFQLDASQLDASQMKTDNLNVEEVIHHSSVGDQAHLHAVKTNSVDVLEEVLTDSRQNNQTVELNTDDLKTEPEGSGLPVENQEAERDMFNVKEELALDLSVDNQKLEVKVDHLKEERGFSDSPVTNQAVEAKSDDLKEERGVSPVNNQAVEAESDDFKEENGVSPVTNQAVEAKGDDLEEENGVSPVTNQAVEAKGDDLEEENGVSPVNNQAVKAKGDDLKEENGVSVSPVNDRGVEAKGDDLKEENGFSVSPVNDQGVEAKGDDLKEERGVSDLSVNDQAVEAIFDDLKERGVPDSLVDNQAVETDAGDLQEKGVATGLSVDNQVVETNTNDSQDTGEVSDLFMDDQAGETDTDRLQAEGVATDLPVHNQVIETKDKGEVSTDTNDSQENVVSDSPGDAHAQQYEVTINTEGLKGKGDLSEEDGDHLLKEVAGRDSAADDREVSDLAVDNQAMDTNTDDSDGKGGAIDPHAVNIHLEMQSKGTHDVDDEQDKCPPPKHHYQPDVHPSSYQHNEQELVMAQVECTSESSSADEFLETVQEPVLPSLPTSDPYVTNRSEFGIPSSDEEGSSLVKQDMLGQVAAGVPQGDEQLDTESQDGTISDGIIMLANQTHGHHSLTLDKPVKDAEENEESLEENKENMVPYSSMSLDDIENKENIAPSADMKGKDEDFTPPRVIVCEDSLDDENKLAISPNSSEVTTVLEKFQESSEDEHGESIGNSILIESLSHEEADASDDKCPVESNDVEINTISGDSFAIESSEVSREDDSCNGEGGQGSFESEVTAETPVDSHVDDEKEVENDGSEGEREDEELSAEDQQILDKFYSFVPKSMMDTVAMMIPGTDDSVQKDACPYSSLFSAVTGPVPGHPPVSSSVLESLERLPEQRQKAEFSEEVHQIASMLPPEMMEALKSVSDKTDRSQPAQCPYSGHSLNESLVDGKSESTGDPSDSVQHAPAHSVTDQRPPATGCPYSGSKPDDDCHESSKSADGVVKSDAHQDISASTEKSISENDEQYDAGDAEEKRKEGEQEVDGNIVDNMISSLTDQSGLLDSAKKAVESDPAGCPYSAMHGSKIKHETTSTDVSETGDIPDGDKSKKVEERMAETPEGKRVLNTFESLMPSGKMAGPHGVMPLDEEPPPQCTKAMYQQALEGLVRGEDVTKNLPPVRGSLNKKKKKKKRKKVPKEEEKKEEKPKETRISGYDYRNWDKFDVEKECAKIDMQSWTTSEEDSSGDTDEEWEAQRRIQQAILLKDQGNQYLKEKKLDEAIECYTQGISCDPSNALLPANRAMALIKQDKYGAAEVDCTTAITLDPTYIKAYARRGTSRAALGKLEEARSDFERVLKLEPKNKQAQTELEKIEKKLHPTIESDSGIVKAIYKPPEKRSKKPLRRIMIEEIGEDKDEINQAIEKTKSEQSETKQKITQKDDSLFERLAQPVIQSKDSALDDDRSGLKLDLAGLDDHHDRVNGVHTEENDGGGSAESDRINERVTSGGSEGASPITSPRISAVPTSSFQFQADWKELRGHPEKFFHYFKEIQPSQYCKLFGQALDSDILVLVLSTLKHFYVPSNLPIYESLKALTAVKRFSMTVMFFSSVEKQVLIDLFAHLRSEENCEKTALDDLAKAYGVA